MILKQWRDIEPCLDRGVSALFVFVLRDVKNLARKN